MRTRGYDISYAQGRIDWSLFGPHARGDVLMIRSTSADGGLHRDTWYMANSVMATQHDVDHGSYHFGKGIVSPEEEADYYVANTVRLDGDPMMLDFEGRVLTVSHPVEWAHRFVTRCFTHTSVRPMLYMSQATLDEFQWAPVVEDNYGLWVARWGTVPPDPHPWPFWAGWQDSNMGTAPGISGHVDTDWFNGSLAQFRKYGLKVSD